MADVLFTNVRIFDGGGETPFTGEVLVQGNRISRVTRSGYGARPLPVAGATVVDGAGAFLMPGMVEAHTHFSWNDQPSLDAIQRMPPEEHILWCAEVAKKYLDMGWTSCVGAATAKPRLDVVIRNAINGESGSFLRSVYDGDVPEWTAAKKSKPLKNLPALKSIGGKIEVLYLTALSRRPSQGEVRRLESAYQNAGGRNPVAAFQDVYWAILNSNEFILNH